MVRFFKALYVLSELTGGNPTLSGMHEKDSVISSVISAAHRKTKLSSSSMKTSSALDESGKRAKKDIVSLPCIIQLEENKQ